MMRTAFIALFILTFTAPMTMASGSALPDKVTPHGKLKQARKAKKTKKAVEMPCVPSADPSVPPCPELPDSAVVPNHDPIIIFQNKTQKKR